MKFILPVGLTSALLLSACTLYKPDNVDLSRDSAEWLQVSRELCPPGAALSPEDLHRLGLQFNPGLNKARLTYARSTAVARYAGLWADPSLSADAERVLKEHFYNKTLGASLTLPVTGLPGLNRKVAEQYKEADYWDMRAQELEFCAKLDTLRNAIMVLHERHRLMQERMRVMENEMSRIERLHSMGEVSFAEYQVACQRLIDTRKDSQETDKTHLEKHLELASLVGLHPDCRDFELQGKLPENVPALRPVPTADALLSAYSLCSLRASYGAGELELRREIRRQYPEISLSPSFKREEGENKLGLGLELDIPLWNRNREAIAAAWQDRAIKRNDLIAKWRDLQQEAVGLGDKQSLAIAHCRTEFSDLSRLQENARRQEQLFSLGETSLPELAEARHELFQRRLSYLECLGQLLDVQTALQYLIP